MKNPDPIAAEPYKRLATAHYCEAAQHLAAILAHLPQANDPEYAYALGCQIADLEASLEEAKAALLIYVAMHSRPQGEA